MRNIWKDAVMGVVVGDALGCPVQFESRGEVAEHPVTDMRGNGTFNLPAGSWTDDSSLTLALLDSLRSEKKADLDRIMANFVAWLERGEFTPFGYSFDIGSGTMKAIRQYERNPDPRACGGTMEWNNGNGSLMRIMPACVWCCDKGLEDTEAVALVHAVGSLTHAHIRSNIACGLYYFMARAILEDSGTLAERLQAGLNRGFAFYGQALEDNLRELARYDRLRDLDVFAAVPEKDIGSSGYVVDSLEAAVWSLLNGNTFEASLLRAVNLGEDTDTVGAITGGLAGLYYGFDAIPPGWVDAIRRKDWILEMCDGMIG